MYRTRTILGWIILVVAVVAMIIPLPGQDDSHLLSEAEANDATLVILTTTENSYIQPLVDQFVGETGTTVRVEIIDSANLTTKTIKNNHADIVLANHVDELVPLIQDNALDTLPLDIMWNVHEGFRDPAERWVGFTGRIEDGNFAMSGLALAQSSNSKPLAERFILYLYSRGIQEQLVNTSGEYSFLAFGVPTPANMPQLVELEVPSFGDIYNSAALTAAPSDTLASAE